MMALEAVGLFLPGALAALGVSRIAKAIKRKLFPEFKERLD